MAERIDSSEWFDAVKTSYLETQIRTTLVHGHDLSTLYRATEAAFTEVARIEDRTGEPCPVIGNLWQAYCEKDLDSKVSYSLFFQVLYYLRKHGAERCAERLRAALDARPHVLEAADARASSDETEPV